MKFQIKKQWVAALKSRKYKQGRKELHPTPDTFCCLGVLCDLYLKSPANVNPKTTWNDLEHEGTLPDEVMYWAGLSSPDPYVPSKLEVNGGHITLSELNDTHEWPFYKIANKIEASL